MGQSPQGAWGRVRKLSDFRIGSRAFPLDGRSRLFHNLSSIDWLYRRATRPTIFTGSRNRRLQHSRWLFQHRVDLTPMDAFQGNLNASLPITILSGTTISDFSSFGILLIDLSINIKVSSNEILDQSNPPQACLWLFGFSPGGRHFSAISA